MPAGIEIIVTFRHAHMKGNIISITMHSGQVSVMLTL